MNNELKNTNEVTPYDTGAEVMVVNRNDFAPAEMMNSLLNREQTFFCSINNDGSRANAVRIYNAINSAKEKADDHKNEVLNIVDVAAHPITITDENTGELINTMRVVLIDENGVGYEAVSQGIVSSLTKLFAVVGQPTWTPALALKIVEQKTRKGFKTNTIELV